MLVPRKWVSVLVPGTRGGLGGNTGGVVVLEEGLSVGVGNGGGLGLGGNTAGGGLGSARRSDVGGREVGQPGTGTPQRHRDMEES